MNDEPRHRALELDDMNGFLDTARTPSRCRARGDLAGARPPAPTILTTIGRGRDLPSPAHVRIWNLQALEHGLTPTGRPIAPERFFSAG